jgi:hypothetical protein
MFGGLHELLVDPVPVNQLSISVLTRDPTGIAHAEAFAPISATTQSRVLAAARRCRRSWKCCLMGNSLTSGKSSTV